MKDRSNTSEFGTSDSDVRERSQEFRVVQERVTEAGCRIPVVNSDVVEDMEEIFPSLWGNDYFEQRRSSSLRSSSSGMPRPASSWARPFWIAPSVWLSSSSVSSGTGWSNVSEATVFSVYQFCGMRRAIRERRLQLQCPNDAFTTRGATVGHTDEKASFMITAASSALASVASESNCKRTASCIGSSIESWPNRPAKPISARLKISDAVPWTTWFSAHRRSLLVSGPDPRLTRRFPHKLLTNPSDSN
jgi:hypothetical protein